MTKPFLPLLSTNLRAWFGAKGFALVVAAAFVPLALTGAWVATHRADVGAVSLEWDDEHVVDGDVVRFTGVVKNTGAEPVGAFNATLAVGTVFNARFLTTEANTTRIEGLDPGEERTLTLEWTARAGTYYALLDADPLPATFGAEDELAEIDEYNNQIPKPLVVAHPPPDPAKAPAAPANLTGAPDGAPADVRVALGDVSTLAPGDNATFTATVANDGPARVENASVVLRVARPFGDGTFPVKETDVRVSLDAGASEEVRLLWTAQEGAYWLETSANVTGNVTDADGEDNHAVEGFTVDPVLGPDAEPPKPPEKLTLKQFYLQVLSLLHLRVLVPLIGLFYAAGVVADERERGALPYLLTRPVERWVFPLTKFVASYLVASVAIALGILGTYLVVFQALPATADVGFVTTPLLVSLLALFAYGALFTLLGVVVERPYLVGLAFVLGWEFVAATFVPWVANFTLYQHLANAIAGWSLDQGVQWLPEGEDALRALRVVLIATAVFLVAASVAMKRREFEV